MNKFESKQALNFLNRKIYDPYKDGVTQGLLGTYRSCPSLARLVVNGIRSGGKPSRALIYGSMFHDMLDLYYKQLINDPELIEKLSTDPKIIVTLIEQISAKIGDNIEKKVEREAKAIQAEGESYDKGAALEELSLIASQAMAVFSRYIVFWQSQDRQFKVIDSEDSFRINLVSGNGKNIPFVGKIDRIAVETSFTEENGVLLEQKDIWLVETKTKSKYDLEKIVLSLRNNIQVKVYLLALYKMYNVFPKGVIYDISRSPDKKYTYDFIAKDALDRPEFYFQRIKLAIPKEDILEAEKIFSNELTNFIMWFKSSPKLDPMYSQNCISHFGACPALTYCASNKTYIGDLKINNNVFPELSVEE